MRGCDCWGLARLVYLQELGIRLPAYTETYSSAEETAEVAALLERRHHHPTWAPVEQSQPFDLILYRHGRLSTHVGIVINRHRMLHVQGDDQSKIEDRNSNRWAARFIGAYRHVEMPLKGGST